MQFKERHAIITGGSSGIGKATACLLLQKGASVTIIGRDRLKLTQAVSELAAAKVLPSQQILSLVADVAEQQSIERAIEQGISQLGSPHILVTSAGIAHPGYFSELAIEVFERAMAVNYFGSLYSIKAVLPAMKKQKGGQIVLISSGAGLIGLYGYTAYSPSKFAVRGLAEALRGELKQFGIGVAIVYPPDTDTPQLAAENQTKPLETKQITATAQTWTAANVASAIVRGIEKNSFAIAPGLEMNLLNRFGSILLPTLNWYFDRIVARVGLSK